MRKRGLFLLGFQLVAIVGFGILAESGKPNIQHTGTVFAAISIHHQIPLGMTWNSKNIGGRLRRGTGIAMQAVDGNSGGIITSYASLSRDGPRFITGQSILLGSVFMAFFVTLLMSTWCRMENAKRDEVSMEMEARELTEMQKMLVRELADSVPRFGYTV